MELEALLQVGMPVMMGVSGVIAWRIAKRGNAKAESKPAWHDDSLDDWRREREAERRAAAERDSPPGPDASPRD